MIFLERLQSLISLRGNEAIYIGGIPDLSKLGEIRNNNKGTPMKIVAYRSSDDIDVQFLDDFYYIKEHQAYVNFKNGTIKNPYDRTVLDIGYLGVGKHKIQYPETKTNTKIYMSWKNMLDRCYYEKHKERNPSYYNTSTVCNDWHNFQTFADWYEEHEYHIGDERLHLDKDIKYPGNTVYSPQTCILVPQRINMMFVNKSNNRGLPNGITKGTKGYYVKYNHEKLGVYPTIEDAYYVQTQKKKEAIIQLANEYKNIIPKYIYDIVVSYEFDIRNDRNYVA